MTRATLFYPVMLLLGAAGITAVLLVGAGLRAPPDISGVWLVAEERPGQDREETMIVEQSGQFVRISFDDGPFEDYRLETLGGVPGDRHLRLTGATRVLLLSRSGESEVHRLERRDPGGSVTVATAVRRAPAAPGVAPAPGAAPPAIHPSGGGGHPVLLLLGQLCLIIVLSNLLGTLATLIRQPRVVGEMVGGIMLGPSLLGWALPGFSAALFPPASVQFLGLLAQLGVIFFLFVIGLELDPRLLRNRGRAAVVISHVGLVAPLVLGAMLALFLYGIVFNDSPTMRFSSVALFMGTAMSVTAFPVLARILTERNLHKTQVGVIAITCAAVGDASAWCLLAFVVALARSGGLEQAAVTTILSVLYILLMLFAVRPFLARLEVYYDRRGRLTTGVLSLLLLIVLCSALATAAIGIHALFGAFMAGAIMPNGTRFVRDVSNRIEEFTLIVLLPVFFAYTGLKTRIELLNSAELWLITAIIIGIACAGKFGGSTLAAVACGMKWREASAIGILMNTRGLMELVILNIGRELGVITDAVFAMMVLMALVTTFLTTPILHWVYPPRLIRARPPLDSAAPRHASVLIPISLPRSARALVRVADLITGPGAAARRIVGLHLRRAVEHDAYSAGAGRAAETPEPLAALSIHGEELGMTIEPVSFVTRDAAIDIVRTADEYGVGLVLMGFHKPIIGSTILGGTVYRVFQEARVDVAIFVDRGLADRPRTLLVPYLGSEHDRLALKIASTMARHSGAAVTVLHVVPKAASGQGERERLHAQAVTEQVFTDPSQPAPVTFKVVEGADPITAVLDHCKTFDLVLIGIAQQWGLTSQLFGWRAERIARDCPTSMLIVRKAPNGPDELPRSRGDARRTLDVHASAPSLPSAGSASPR